MFGRESTANLHALLIHLDAGAIKDVARKNLVQCFLQILEANPLSKGIMYAAIELVHQNDLKLKQYGHQCYQSSDTMCAQMNIPSATLKKHLPAKFGGGDPYFRFRLAYSTEYHQYPNRLVEKSSSEAFKLT